MGIAMVIAVVTIVGMRHRGGRGRGEQRGEGD
jgi:hypothetical protein